MCDTTENGRYQERAERKLFEEMRVRLQDAFAMPDIEYEHLSADDIRRRATSLSKAV